MAGEIKITSDLVKTLIAARHKGRQGEWMVFPELRDGTGFISNGQQIDVFAMNTWPSKGFARVAYEIKVSRADFIREMNDPAKRAWAMEISHQFYFVAPSDVIKDGELPLDCGFLVITKNGDKLRTMKVAPHRKPRELKMHEIAAILRAADVHSKDTHWKYAGQDLTEAQLFELVSEKRGYAERMEINKMAGEIADRKTNSFVALVKAWAEEFKRAGFEPPEWMSSGVISTYPHTWEIKEWIKKNVAPGADCINEALKLANMAQQNICKAIESIETLKLQKKDT